MLAGSAIRSSTMGRSPGNAIAPQTGLAAAVLQQHARHRRAATGWRKDDRAGQAAEELRVGLGGIELAQHDLAVRQGQLEDPVGQPPVADICRSGPAHASRVSAAPRTMLTISRCFRLQRDPTADRHDRIQDRALAVRKRPGFQGCGLRGAAAPADELAAGRSRSDVSDLLGSWTAIRCNIHGGLFLRRAGPARAEDAVPVADDFRLDEQVVERRMRGVGAGRGQHHLGVARSAPGCARPRTVGDAHAAQLDVIFGRDGDLGVGIQIQVAPAELRPGLRRRSPRSSCRVLRVGWNAADQNCAARRRRADIAEGALLVAASHPRASA